MHDTISPGCDVVSSDTFLLSCICSAEKPVSVSPNPRQLHAHSGLCALTFYINCEWTEDFPAGINEISNHYYYRWWQKVSQHRGDNIRRGLVFKVAIPLIQSKTP